MGKEIDEIWKPGLHGSVVSNKPTTKREGSGHLDVDYSGTSEEKTDARVAAANLVARSIKEMDDGKPFEKRGSRLVKKLSFNDEITIMVDEPVTEEIVRLRWNSAMVRIMALAEKLQVTSKGS